MEVLDELRARTSSTLREEVHSVVLVLSAPNQQTPRLIYRPASLARKHLVYTTARGLYTCDLKLSGKRRFFSDFYKAEVFELENRRRLDSTMKVSIERNWPSWKLSIDEREYSVPVNFLNPLKALLPAA